MARDTVRVRGLRELNRAFAQADKQMKDDLTARLKDAAEPVKADAQGLAGGVIRRMGTVRWDEMRVGAKTHVVYVAPKRRTTRVPGRKRPKFGTRLLERAMLPALERNTEQVKRRVDDLLGDMERNWGRGG